MNIKQVKKAIIPCAGFGTRFLPATKAIAKEMLPIYTKPALQYIVEEVVASGIKEILIVTNKYKKAIEDHFDRVFEVESLLAKSGKTEELKMLTDIASMADIYYVRQKQMRGSGDAILAARSFVDGEPFAVLYGDDIVYNPDYPCTRQLCDAYSKTGKSILGVQNVAESEVSKYGIVKPGAVKGKFTEVKAFVEKPKREEAPGRLASMGRYVLTPDIFDELIRLEPAIPQDKELYLTDAIAAVAAKDIVYAYEFEGKRYDVGDKQGYLEASIEFALRDERLKTGFSKYLKNLAGKL